MNWALTSQLTCRYAVVYDDQYHDTEWDPHSQLYTFPWVLLEELADMKRKATRARRREL